MPLPEAYRRGAQPVLSLALTLTLTVVSKSCIIALCLFLRHMSHSGTNPW